MVQKGEIEQRIDAEFYEESLASVDFIKLKEIAKIKGGKRIPKEKKYSEEETDFWYLRVDSINEFGDIDFNSLKHISKEIFEILENYEFHQDEIAISNAGTIGKIALLSEKPLKRIILTENCAKLVLKNHSVLPKFLKIVLCLPVVQRQMTLAYIQTTIPKLSLDRIENLRIPRIPDLFYQAQIVAQFEAAYAQKRAKEAEAKKLLAGIDEYLLNKLGIHLPEPAEKKKFFYVRANQVSGGRFDSFYHQSEFEELEKALKNGKYGLEKFSNLINYISSGATPLKSESEKYYTADSKNGIPLLRVQNITAIGIELDDVVFINHETHEKDLKRSQVFSGDLLITITGRIASSAVAPQNFEGNINQHSVVVRTDKNYVFNEYLAIYFNSFTGQKFALRKTTGGTRPALDYVALKSVLIPLPPLAVQTEIAEHVGAIRAQAKRREQEAKEIVERAKKEVEMLILQGDESCSR